MLFNRYWDEKREKLIHPVADAIIEQLLHSGANIIIDETCCRKAFRDKFLYLVTASGRKYKTVCVYFKISKKECYRRNKLRDKRVDDWVIDKIDAIFQPPKKSEGFDEFITVFKNTLL